MNKVKEQEMLLLPNETKNKILPETKILLSVFAMVVAALVARGNAVNMAVQSLANGSLDEAPSAGILRQMNQEYVKRVSVEAKSEAEKVDAHQKALGRAVASIVAVKTAE